MGVLKAIFPLKGSRAQSSRADHPILTLH